MCPPPFPPSVGCWFQREATSTLSALPRFLFFRSARGNNLSVGLWTAVRRRWVSVVITLLYGTWKRTTCPADWGEGGWIAPRAQYYTQCLWQSSGTQLFVIWFRGGFRYDGSRGKRGADRLWFFTGKKCRVILTQPRWRVPIYNIIATYLPVIHKYTYTYIRAVCRYTDDINIINNIDFFYYFVVPRCIII